MVDYCLEAAGIPLERLDLVVRNSYVLPVGEMERRLRHRHHEYHLPARERLQALDSPLFLGSAPRVVDVSHHLAHAYSAFAASPFEEGAVMVVDGVGSYRSDVTEAMPACPEVPPLSRESESYYRFRGREITCLRKEWLLPSKGFLNEEFYEMAGLGALYSRVSTYMFGDWNKCGEVMGLAPYGRAGHPPLLSLRDGVLDVPAWDDGFHHPFVGKTDGEWEGSLFRKEWEDLAFRVQEDAERVLVARAKWLHEATGARNLCIAGGVGLNCVANGKILERSPFESIWIQPAAGDDGIAIGCARYGHLQVRGHRRTFVQKHSFLGREYGEEEIDEALSGPLVRSSLRTRLEGNAPARAAELLAGGKVLGWFQGGSEFGPRALGHRSILADARDPAMKDHVNARVKHRQSFRPFAPAVLAHRAVEWFEGEAESPFMLLVRRVRPDRRDRIPSIVHVDGTARVQTVREEENPVLHALLLAFEERTGVPVVLNTSFNLRGEPIVETPRDAVECLLRTRMDALVLHDRVVEKHAVGRALFPVVARITRARGALRSGAILEGMAHQVLNK